MMRPTELWPKRARIIEVGARSGAIGERLVASGFRNYLAVVASGNRRDTFVRRWPGLQRNSAVALPLNDLRQNNADVLVLDGWAALATGRYRSVRHAEFVALKLQLTPLCWIALLLALGQCLIYRFGWPQGRQLRPQRIRTMAARVSQSKTEAVHRSPAVHSAPAGDRPLSAACNGQWHEACRAPLV